MARQGEPEPAPLRHCLCPCRFCPSFACPHPWSLHRADRGGPLGCCFCYRVFHQDQGGHGPPQGPSCILQCCQGLQLLQAHAGKGKMRNCGHHQHRGPLVVYNEDNGIVKAFCNLPGVEQVNVRRLNLLQLTPGGHLGRFVIWTEGAFALLDEVLFQSTKRITSRCYAHLFSSFLTRISSLPTAKIMNPDVTHLHLMVMPFPLHRLLTLWALVSCPSMAWPLADIIVRVDLTPHSHHSTLATYLTVGCLINPYGRRSLLLWFTSPIFHWARNFHLACEWMPLTFHIVCCKAGDDGHQERSGLARRRQNLMTNWAIPSLEHRWSPSTPLSTHWYHDLDHLSVLAFLCCDVASPCCESQTALSMAGCAWKYSGDWCEGSSLKLLNPPFPVPSS